MEGLHSLFQPRQDIFKVRRVVSGSIPEAFCTITVQVFGVIPGKVNTLATREKCVAFFRNFTDKVAEGGCRSRLMPDGNTARVHYCRRPGSVTANNRLQYRSTANPSIAFVKFCKLKSQVFQLVSPVDELLDRVTHSRLPDSDELDDPFSSGRRL